MPSTGKRRIQPPPEGCAWIEDYRSEDGTVLVRGIASRLSITAGTYRKWRMRGEGPPTFILAKKVVASIASIDQYLAGLESAAIADAQQAAQTTAHDMRPAEHRASRRTPVAA